MTARPASRIGWRRWAAAGLTVLCTAALPVQAQTAADPLGAKIATDLRLALDAREPARQPWLREAAGQRWVRVLVTGQRRAADMAATRQDVLQRGGNVVSHDASRALMVAVLPASQVRAVAARADVLHVAPDRVAGAAPAVAQKAAAGTAAKEIGHAPVPAHLAAVGLGPNSARAISDRALLGE